MVSFTVNGSSFKELLNTARIISKDVLLQISPSGVTLSMLDPAGVSMLYVHINASAFSNYDVDRAQLVSFDIDRFKILMKTIKDDCKFEFSDDSSFVIVSSSTVKFRTKLLDTSRAKMKDLPLLNFNIVAELPKVPFRDALELCTAVKDEVCISTTSEGIAISSEAEMDEITSIIPMKDIKSEKYELSKCYFDANYLFEIIKGVPSDKVTIKLNSNYPIAVAFKTMNDNADCLMFQAPRIHEP